MSGKIEVSEIFTSVQGEGPSVGTPAIFLRLRGCVLRCRWCDSRYAWDKDDPAYNDFESYEPEELGRKLAAMACQYRHSPLLVITGGEPLIWSRQLQGVIQSYISKVPMEAGLSVEIETSGTIRPTLLSSSDFWERRFVHYNVSPKMPSSGNEHLNPDYLLNYPLLDSFLATGATIKVVVGSEDKEAFEEFYSKLSAKVGEVAMRSQLYLMPEGKTPEELRKNWGTCVEMALALGVRVSPRLQIDIAGGNVRGV